MFYDESDLIRRSSKYIKCKNVIDVGAHIGAFSEYYAKNGWNVVAFEPEKINREILIEKTKSYDNVLIIPKAVTNEAGGKIPFYTSSTHHGIHTIRPFHPTHELAYEVDTTTLKVELQELGIDQISILKVDVEGADFLVLQGFDWEKYRPEIVMIEFMDSRTMKNFGYGHHDVAKYMENKGYRCYVSDWSEIKSYGESGAIYKPLKWLNFAEYPLQYEPVWGNLIFTPVEDKETLSKMKSWQRMLNMFNGLYPLIYRAKALWRLTKRISMFRK